MRKVSKIKNLREEKGKEIAGHEGQIKRISDNEYQVHSQSKEFTVYSIRKTATGRTCSCPDHQTWGVRCKHVFAIQFSQRLKEELRENITIKPVEINRCLFCHSEDVVKTGIRRNKEYAIQRFKCHACGRTFSVNIGFEHMKHNPKAITIAMQLYFSGESLRNTMRALKLMGTQVSHQTVYNWITKYTELMQRYLDNIIPQVGDVWRTDELFIKVKGNLTHLFSMMDDQTRYWISSMVADHKGVSDVRPMYQEAKEATGKRPSVLISDGAPNFHTAFNKEFYSNKKDSKHISHIHFKGDRNNNKMERMNGETRDREKIMRGLKTKASPILTGYQLYHNYIRPHEALKGKTPSEVAGITVKGTDKFMTLIQNASVN
ncbi:MAG: DDE-type integrase/transposase/recombinase [Thermoplasmatales archaeon]|nr:DDE-type integrase/transposase/recombinase [Thermoplasmatales archaeon]